MAAIKGKNTKPEMLVRKFLRAYAYRYRLHDKKLPGKPDIVLPKYKTVIFVHGCFWHGHAGCRYFVVPKTRTDWWLEKISTNKRRDMEKLRQLKLYNWQILTIFECQLKPKQIDRTLNKLFKKLNISE